MKHLITDNERVATVAIVSNALALAGQIIQELGGHELSGLDHANNIDMLSIHFNNALINGE